ncbi:uncharacterized GPI-anchored protein At4g28100-like [Neltuma alba]|uniref:uncharacterized GPI-anchored protein At4g28100-like n=1 Tax=Neltuma alba TaxID=207710 RepID=UPI0010A2FB7C|nr:uncharacterized GPI-anchored protein At4g28100-like [Prosopis alba]
MPLLPEYPLFYFCIIFPCFVALPYSGATTVQPIVPNPSPPITIPAVPEQSELTGCSLNLSEELFHGVKTACSATKEGAGGELHRSRCCPVLAAWLYSAYSATALGSPTPTTSSDMPLLPDDSETCVNGLGKALKLRGIELIQPNETCDVVYCYCGIRLHPLSCPEAFSVTHSGKLVGNKNVRRLERNCLSSSINVNKFPGLGGCSKCLNSLHSLTKKTTSNSSKTGDRTAKIHNKDCELMGLTWLLVKNQTAYMRTVSGVLRALMLSTNGPYPKSCSLNSDGKPMAVDSSEISDHSASVNLQAPVFLRLFLLSLLLLLHLTMLAAAKY